MHLLPDIEIPPTAGLPLKASDWLPGPARLAQRAASLLDVPSLQLECSGSAALVVALLALRSLDGERDEVIVPAFTCALVAMAVEAAGLQVRVCDTAPGQFDFHHGKLAGLAGERTLAIMPTHLAGRVADVDATLAIARGIGAFVIEDAAQSFGATDRGRSVGLRGDIGFFSLAAGKGLSIYEGGLLLARDPGIRDALRVASERHVEFSLPWEARRLAELAGYGLLYRPRGLRLAYGNGLRKSLREGDLVAAVGDDASDGVPVHRVGRWRNAVGARAIYRLPEFLAATRAQAQRRLPLLTAIDGVHVFDDVDGQRGTWPFLMLRMRDECMRDAVLDKLWTAGLGVSRLFIHALPDYHWLRAMRGSDDIPNARDFAARTLTISNSPWLDEARFDAILEVLRAS